MAVFESGSKCGPKPRAVRGCFSGALVPRGAAFRDDWQALDKIASVDTIAWPPTKPARAPWMQP
jgi:hypothetical protein